MLFRNFVPDCVRSNLRGSKFKIFLGGHAHILQATTCISFTILFLPPHPSQNPL